jgi:hypothetical protein
MSGNPASNRWAILKPMPWWLLSAKVLLAVLLLVGALFPDVGGFAGKGMAFRLPIFLAPALIVPLVAVLRRNGRYSVELDIALTFPFLLDTLGNAVGLYDSWNPTDDVLHAVNWVILVYGVTAHFVRNTAAGASPRWFLWLAGTGFGAIAIIYWELAEYLVMQAGVAGLALTYGDTVGDLVLSSAGGAIGALIAVRSSPQRPLGAPTLAG